AVFAPGTEHGSAQAGAVAAVGAHDPGNGVGGLVAAGGALVDGRAILHDGLGIVGAARVAAAAAVGARQTFGNFRDTRVLIHGHEFGGQNQDQAADQAKHHQHDDRKQDRVHSLHSPFLQDRIDDVFHQA